ncbi:hypothetical protein QSJ18_07090 [Gordonia sp. ABSL1-1]|uniref:hypothetical protein n=1 Tax=Gordonia sp. ABSL1-1 TaxID=3053923 RepID=UPI0025746CC4|nr:hypothetical protein [Gordonia sp. ABSL1-1]MDL9936503.1 hypothetical protein [Gordonia sp. ABSL1-1]
MGRTTRRLLAATLAVLVVAGLVATGVLGYRYWDGRQTENARGESLEAAKRYATTMFGFNPENVTAHVDSSMAILTGAAKPEYATLVRDNNLAAEVRKQGVVSEVTMQDAGVVTNTRTTSTVLLFLNQSVTRGGNKELVSVNPSRVQYAMEKDGDVWLVNGIEVITDDSFRSKIDVSETVPPNARPAPGLATPPGSPTPRPGTPQSPTLPPAVPLPGASVPTPTP